MDFENPLKPNIRAESAPEPPPAEKKKESLGQKAKKAAAIAAAAGVFALGGDALNQKPVVEKPDKFSKYTQYLGQSAGEKERQEFIEKIQYLSEKFGPEVMGKLKFSDSFEKQRRENTPEKPEITGFENLGIANKKLHELWNDELYPKGLINGNLAEIKYVPKSEKFSHYGKDYYYAGSVEPLSDDIKIYGFSAKTENNLEASKKNLDWSFSHELGHQNDWGRDHNLNFEQRINFLHKISKSFEEPGSFRDQFGYIDSIKKDNKKLEQYYKTSEYWATLCEYYFSFPEMLKEESPKDFALVDEWIKQKDPNYDTFSAHQKRAEILKVIIENRK